ncbi:MAG: hypothetical protein HFI86_06760 [Bacilli bacterium]|nr:hypothetical protein [Bacilli bacterium]
MSKSIKFKNDYYLDSSSIKMNGNWARLTLEDYFQSSNKSHYLITNGWYRIAEIFKWSAENFNFKPQNLIIHLGVDYSWFNGSDYLVSICKGGSAINGKILNSANGSSKCITKLRITTVDNKHYLEIYWAIGNGTDRGNNLMYNIFSFTAGIKIQNPELITDEVWTRYTIDL